MRLALDWTPNTNHIGFFIARELGYFNENGLQIEILDPREDDYYLTPAKKLELGKADLALCPTESILSYKTKDNPFEMVGIAAIYKEDLSAIAVKKSLKVRSPKNLDQRSYASYNAKYEDKIVQKMIQNDGGKGDIKLVYPKKLGIWNTIVNDKYDATWIFVNWEGVQANDAGLDLELFQLSDFGIPYSYSPVITVSNSSLVSNRKEYERFLKATKKGFIFAKENQKEAIEIFSKFIPKEDDIDLEKSLDISAVHFGSEEDWGIMKPSVVNQFLSWLSNEGLEPRKFTFNEIMSNELLTNSN